MSASSTDLGPLLPEGPQSLLERTLIGEYLLSQGYLMADVKKLPPLVAKRLMSNASRFASFRLAEIEAKVEFRHKIRPPISPN